jgi:ArsR family transcriptional regulator
VDAERQNGGKNTTKARGELVKQKTRAALSYYIHPTFMMMVNTILTATISLQFSQVYLHIRIYSQGEQMNVNLELEITQLHAEICAGLADPNRILILYELSQSPRNVTELSTNLKMPQPLVSRHLKILRERGMVIPKRHGTVIQYTLADDRLIQALDLLRAVMRDGLAKRAELVEALA